MEPTPTAARARAVLLSLLPSLVALSCASGVGPTSCSVVHVRAPEVVPELPAHDARAWVRDASGGAVVLRGVNLAGAAKYRRELLYVPTDAELRRLRVDLGASAIRLLVFWEAIEPAPGRYDETYLSAVRRVIERAARHDLRVIVDVHQDLFGRGFGFAGAPRWACDEASYAAFEPPDPWFVGYLDPAIAHCFDRLFGDEALRGRYGAALGRLARALRGVDGLFGYDLMNEPHWGRLTPDVLERDVAPLAYTEWADAIRASDPRAWVMVQPVPLRSFEGATELRAPERSRVAYAPHLYDSGVELNASWDGDREQPMIRARRVVADAQRMGVPLVIGELGGRRHAVGVAGYTEALYDALDAAMLGALHWDGARGGDESYGLFELDGGPSPSAAHVARPHPERTAGTPREWSWDPKDRVFRFTWDEDPTLSGETRVTLPRLALGASPRAVVEPAGPLARDGAALVIPPVHRGLRLLIVEAGP